MSDAEPPDYYGVALKAMIKRGEPFPELAAALYAQLTEAIQSMISKTEAIDNLIGKPDTPRKTLVPDRETADLPVDTS